MPPPAEAAAVAGWLAGPRGRLLRRVQVARRRRVLELGCGHGIITQELLRRAGGTVVALDRDPTAASHVRERGALLVQAEAECLPFSAATFDLVVSENVLMWVSDLDRAVREVTRCLEPGGALVALEPDFGGMMEHPPEIALQDLWLTGLSAAGADPLVGRKIPGACERAGLHVWAELQGLPQPADGAGARLLLGLPLTASQRQRVQTTARALDARSGLWDPFVHVPYVLVVADKPRTAALSRGSARSG